jgi:hypothetical protein
LHNAEIYYRVPILRATTLTHSAFTVCHRWLSYFRRISVAPVSERWCEQYQRDAAKH